jgi:hypothetical protein
MPRGYRNKDGDMIETTVPDLTWQTISPKPKVSHWYCTKCLNLTYVGSASTTDMVKMQLMPISKDIPATHWR